MLAVAFCAAVGPEGVGVGVGVDDELEPPPPPQAVKKRTPQQNNNFLVFIVSIKFSDKHQSQGVSLVQFSQN